MLPLLAAHPHISYILMYAKNPDGRADLTANSSSDIVTTVSAYFIERIQAAGDAGMQRSQLILDPGMGAFVSPDPEDSRRLLQAIPTIKIEQTWQQRLLGLE